MGGRKMRRQSILSFLLIVAGAVGLLPVAALQVRAQEGTPGASPVAEPTAEIISEQGPVFVSNGWRVSVVGVVRAAGVNAIGLRQGEDRDWLPIVADVTNLSSEPATFDVGRFSLRFRNEDRPGDWQSKPPRPLHGGLILSRPTLKQALRWHLEQPSGWSSSFGSRRTSRNQAFFGETRGYHLNERLPLTWIFGNYHL